MDIKGDLLYTSPSLWVQDALQEQYLTTGLFPGTPVLPARRPWSLLNFLFWAVILFYPLIRLAISVVASGNQLLILGLLLLLIVGKHACSHSNTHYTHSNAHCSHSNTHYTHSNTHCTHSNTHYAHSNTHCTHSNTHYTHSNAHYTHSNTHYTHSNTHCTHSNTHCSHSNTHYTHSNTHYTHINTHCSHLLYAQTYS